MSDELYIGLMSGTSMDGIDAVLIDFSGESQQLIGSFNQPWPKELRAQLRLLAQPGCGDIDLLGQVDTAAADLFAHAAVKLLTRTGKDARRIKAIGSHGQTIRHRPELERPFTMQIGDPSRIAELTGITIVADFRRRDLAAGGQGAPLVPAYHAAFFSHPEQNRVILNIGGIANITLLPSERAGVSGFDTGPGNTLLDQWIREQLGQDVDYAGAWGATGRVNETLLSRMLEDPFFAKPPPKSTGLEYFNLRWLQDFLDQLRPIKPEDVQATLIALTSRTISDAIARYQPNSDLVIACGGGSHNKALMHALLETLGGIEIETSSRHNIHPDQVEAAAFAWLARQTLHSHPGNLPTVTGASHAVVLGGIYPA